MKIFIGLGLQIAIALILLKIPLLKDFFLFLNKFVLALEKATQAGSSFLFGYLGGGALPFAEATPGASYIIAFRVLPIVLVTSALSAVLFHWGILQKVVRFFSMILEKTLKIDGVQGFGVAANIFLGIVEAPLLVRPYLKSMSRSSLFVVMCAGMSTVAGTVMVLYASLLNPIIPGALTHIMTASLMSAPATVILAHLLIPQSETTLKFEEPKRTSSSVMEALLKGTSEGIQLLLSILAMILVLFALVNLVDQGLALIPFNEESLSLEIIGGFLLRPFAWLMGIPWSETLVAGKASQYQNYS